MKKSHDSESNEGLSVTSGLPGAPDSLLSTGTGTSGLVNRQQSPDSRRPLVVDGSTVKAKDSSILRLDSRSKESLSETPIEKQVLATFKELSKMQRTRQDQILAARRDEMLKAKAFSETFILSTPVPKDLVNIIIKTPRPKTSVKEDDNMHTTEKKPEEPEVVADNADMLMNSNEVPVVAKTERVISNAGQTTGPKPRQRKKKRQPGYVIG